MNRNNHPVEIDHIDPRWKEGRDYQLVCGLNCPLNYREEDWKKNTSKSNRFLPWRWSRDEIGVVPTELGDLAWFLVGADIETDTPGEWILMEFLSDEWMKATISSTGVSYHTRRRDNHSSVLKQWETLRKSPELISQRADRMKKTFEDKGLKNGFQIRWRCRVTGLESNIAGVIRLQRNRGIEPTPENRSRIN